MKKVIFVLMLIIVIFTACSKSPGTTTPETKPIPVAQYYEVPRGISPLTGLPMEGNGRAIMVQIENTGEARPQSGIAQADLIYEIEVESNITRLTAFFMSSYPEKVGPVRSARKQHIQLWKEWDYLYTFYGGSKKEGQNIYEIIDELNIQTPYIDGTKTSNSYSRSSDRKAPHNAYTDTSYLIENAYDYEPKHRSIYFDEEADIEGDLAKEVVFSYRSDNKIKYIYNSQNGFYKRFINEEPMIDKESNEQVTIKNIIIQHANHYKVTDTVYTNIDLIDSGKAQYFTNGIIRTGTWERKGPKDLTIYYDDKGDKISFKPGITFIQIVRPDTAVTTK